MTFRVECRPAFNYARTRHTTRIYEQKGASFHTDHASDLSMGLATAVPLERDGDAVVGEFSLKAGQSASFALRRVGTEDEAGHVLASWTAQQLRQPLFRSPRSVTADRAGNVYVTDSGRVVTLSLRGQTVHSWSAGGVGATPVGPRGIAIDPHGDVDVLDALGVSVATYAPSGRLLGQWGKRGDAPGDLGQPIAIGVDGQGKIEVVDARDNRVDTFTPLGRLIRYWSIVPYLQSGGGPSGMAVNSQGDVYLSIVDRIFEFSPQGLPIRSWGSTGIGPGRFLSAGAVAVDGRGNVYTTETYEGKRVQKFVYRGIASMARGYQGVLWPRRM